MRNAIIYTRVSTDEQEEKGYSLRDQKARLEKYCSEKGFEVIKHYEDGHSAKTFERPEFIKLLSFVKSNKGFIQKLFVVKWDRFSRDMAGALAMTNTLKKYGVEVEAIEQPLDDDIPENLLMKAIYLATPQVENARRSLNTKNGMRKALKEGRWMATAPFGYKNARDSNNRPIITIKEDKAALVKEAFELYATGVYEKEELRKKLRPKGMSLSKNSFSEMLPNPVYCGKIRVPEYKDEAEEIVDGLHKAIISEEIFYKVQEVATKRKQKKAKPSKQIEELHLRGNLVCSKCGGNLTGSASKGNGGKYFYYHCQPGCNERYRADNAHSHFSQWLPQISFRPEIASLYLAIMEDVFKTREGDRNKEIVKLQSEQAEKREMITKAGIKLVNDDLDKHTFRRIKEQLDSELNAINARIIELQHIESGFAKYSRYGMSLLSNLSHYYETANLEVKQKMIGLIFPEKLEFVEGEYRTKEANEILMLLCSAGKGFRGWRKEKASENGSQSCKVALTGIEPVSKV